MDTLLNTYLFATVLSLIFFSGWFLFALKRNDSSLIEIAYPIGFIVISAFTISYNQNLNNATLLIFNYILVWGARLSIHKTLMKWDEKEDRRYTRLRKQLGQDAWWSIFFNIYLVRAIMLLVVSYPFFVVNTYASSTGSIDFILAGSFVFILGFVIEFVADYQLFKFKHMKNIGDERGWTGNIMKYGLWSAVRHPNYLGEIIMWIGISLIAFTFPLGFLSFISLLFVALYFVYVEIPMIEEMYEGDEEFEDFKDSVGMIIPRFSK